MLSINMIFLHVSISGHMSSVGMIFCHVILIQSRECQQREKFSAQCRAANIPDKMVILDVRTRWNSTFDMLVRTNELKEVNLFLFTLYIIFIIIKIKNLFFFLFLDS